MVTFHLMPLAICIISIITMSWAACHQSIQVFFFAKVPHSPAVVWLLHIILVHFDSDLTWFDTAFVHSVWCLFRRICLRLVWQAATTAKNQRNCGGGRLAQEDVTLWMGCYTRLYIICFVYEQLGLPMPFDELSSDMIQRLIKKKKKTIINASETKCCVYLTYWRSGFLFRR